MCTALVWACIFIVPFRYLIVTSFWCGPTSFLMEATFVIAISAIIGGGFLVWSWFVWSDSTSCSSFASMSYLFCVGIGLFDWLCSLFVLFGVLTWYLGNWKLVICDISWSCVSWEWCVSFTFGSSRTHCVLIVRRSLWGKSMGLMAEFRHPRMTEHRGEICSDLSSGIEPG